MPDATITSKGQMTIPRDVRRAAGLKTGDIVSVHDIGGGVFVVRAKRPMLDRLAGCLAAPRRRRASLKTMDGAVADAAVARAGRGSGRR